MAGGLNDRRAARTTYKCPHHAAHRDQATGEYFYRGKWYDPAEEGDMEALKHRIGMEWEAECDS